MNIERQKTDALSDAVEIPEGATHYDEQDYWKLDGIKWFIWIESCKQWRQIFHYKKFHESIPIKPL